jgi:hypothetical protein
MTAAIAESQTRAFVKAVNAELETCITSYASKCLSARCHTVTEFLELVENFQSPIETCVVEDVYEVF